MKQLGNLSEKERNELFDWLKGKAKESKGEASSEAAGKADDPQ